MDIDSTRRKAFRLEVCLLNHVSVSGRKRPIGKRKSVIVSEPYEGLYEALSKGMALAKGDVVRYLNASGRYVSKALASVDSTFNLQLEIEWLAGCNMFSDESGSVLDARYPFCYNKNLFNVVTTVRIIMIFNKDEPFGQKR